MADAISYTEIIDWEDFVNEFEGYSDTGKFIYRGQSNDVKAIKSYKTENDEIISLEIVEWGLSSLFNRIYNSIRNYSFSKFLSDQLDDNLFKLKYGEYEIVKRLRIEQWSKLDKLMFLQHYGCQTCLIDFTKNPLIALYFGISGMRGSSVSTHKGDGNIYNYPDNCFLSVYQINYDLLKKKIGVKEIDETKDISLEYRNHEIYLDEQLNHNTLTGQSVVSAFHLNPKSVDENYNLEKQQGCFLLYDNRGFNFGGNTFEKFISEFIRRRGIILDDPIVKIYRIRYNSIFSNQYHGELRKSGLFKYLVGKKISGATLFNDLQGLKYDFNFFHEK